MWYWVLNKPFVDRTRIIQFVEPLKFLLTADVPAPRLARLQNRLRYYNYVIEYRAGNANENADALSRMVDEEELTSLIGSNKALDDGDIVINVIRLKADKMNREQLLDDDFAWIIMLS